MDPAADLALVLTGGGARAAYQVGLLRCLGRHLPEARLPIITGVSAGGINAVFLASHSGSLAEAARDLSKLWLSLTPEQVFRVGARPLVANFLRWGTRLASGGARPAKGARALLDTAPLAGFLTRALATVDGEMQGIAHNIEGGRLKAVALTTLKYSTGQTVTWVQGAEFKGWERPNRIGVRCRLSVDHVMASAALPLLFPAVRLGGEWYGDGGVRLQTPLAPAIHLGAERVLAISTRYPRSQREAGRPVISGYPPTAQVVGTLMNAIFLDAIDHDARRMERINELLATCRQDSPGDLRVIRHLVLRPSQDLGRLAADYEPALPRSMRFLTRGLGSHETASPDFLSLLMFQPEYMARLIEIGEADAEARLEELAELIGNSGRS